MTQTECSNTLQCEVVAVHTESLLLYTTEQHEQEHSDESEALNLSRHVSAVRQHGLFCSLEMTSARGM